MSPFMSGTRILAVLAFFILAGVDSARAVQVEVAGPAGSVSFGARVAVLPNGNLVITDPAYNDGGAAYLYSPSGQQISKLTGTPPGSGGGSPSAEWDFIEIIVLANGNYVLNFANGYAVWGSGTSGVSGYVNPSNSAYPAKALALANGNYILLGPLQLPSGTRTAVAWANGKTGFSGTLSLSNAVPAADDSAVGGDGYIKTLPNGHYVLLDGRFVRWLDGTKTSTGASNESNSLYGTSEYDQTQRQVTVLTNGNYVVTSPDWDSPGAPDVGAATWLDGTKAFAGPISAANSLVGSRSGNYVGFPQPGAVALTNGNYVVLSSNWEGNGPANVGAVTWGDGTKGSVGEVSTANSMTGSSENDYVGGNPYLPSVTPLKNGNYVVYATLWDDGGKQNVGAVRWGDGTKPSTGPITHANALYGTESEARIGRGSAYGVVALANGNYVINNSQWPLGMGSVTWGDGETGSAGPVTSANSITGEKDGDYVSAAPLADGNYLAQSDLGRAGGLLWADGFQSTANVVLKFNSVTGTGIFDFVSAISLSDGSYLAGSQSWANGDIGAVGGWRWLRGGQQETGALSPQNAIVGSTYTDYVGNVVMALPRGHYLLASDKWASPDYFDAGAVTLARHASFVGPLNATNSVVGTPPPSGRTWPQDSALFYDYDAARERLVVGRPVNNTVSLFTLDNDLIFADGFESVPRTCEWRLGRCREPQLTPALP